MRDVIGGEWQEIEEGDKNRLLRKCKQSAGNTRAPSNGTGLGSKSFLRLQVSLVALGRVGTNGISKCFSGRWRATKMPIASCFTPTKNALSFWLLPTRCGGSYEC